MIAIAGPNLPHEVLMAAGRHAGPLAFDPEQKVTRAGEWLESKFFPWAPAIVEVWADGGYNDLEAVWFSRADDTSQRLYYYICELQRRGLIAGPEAVLVDIAKIQRASSLKRNAAVVRQLAEKLGVSDDALEEAILAANRLRVAARIPTKENACLIVGSPMPDSRFAKAIDAASFAPVFRTLHDDWMMSDELVAEESGDPMGAIAHGLHNNQSGPRSFADPARRLEQQIAGCDARAVVIWRIEEDEAQTWQLPAERRALARLGVPHLVLTRRDWLGRDGTAAEIGDFLEGLGA